MNLPDNKKLLIKEFKLLFDHYYHIILLRENIDLSSPLGEIQGTVLRDEQLKLWFEQVKLIKDIFDDTGYRSYAIDSQIYGLGFYLNHHKSFFPSIQRVIDNLDIDLQGQRNF